jgi:hypothetical protein
MVGAVNYDLSKSIRLGGTLGLGSDQCRCGRDITTNVTAKAHTAAIERIQSVVIRDLAVWARVVCQQNPDRANTRRPKGHQPARVHGLADSPHGRIPVRNHSARAMRESG